MKTIPNYVYAIANRSNSNIVNASGNRYFLSRRDVREAFNTLNSNSKYKIVRAQINVSDFNSFK